MSMQLESQTKPLTTFSLKPALTGLLQRTCACGQHTGDGECIDCRQKREAMLQRAGVNSAPMNAVPPIVHDVLNSPGQSLDIGTRTFMESRFGYDFSRVRVHTDEQAERSAHSVNALAYTVGRDVVFGTGQYTPETMSGKKLIAHELTHVVQQGNDADNTGTAMRLNSPGDVHEREASTIAADIAGGGFLSPRVAVGSSHADSVVQRQDAGASTPTPSTPSGSSWTSDLITITLNSDQPNCFGITTPSDSSPYSDCYADGTIKAPFCQSVRVPFNVDFLVDRANAQRPRPFKSPTVMSQFN